MFRKAYIVYLSKNQCDIIWVLHHTQGTFRHFSNWEWGSLLHKNSFSFKIFQIEIELLSNININIQHQHPTSIINQLITINQQHNHATIHNHNQYIQLYPAKTYHISTISRALSVIEANLSTTTSNLSAYTNINYRYPSKINPNESKV